MLRDVVEQITNRWALIALVLFAASFVAILIWVFTKRQKTVDKWSRIPLEDEPVTPREGGEAEGDDRTDGDDDDGRP